GSIEAAPKSGPSSAPRHNRTDFRDYHKKFGKEFNWGYGYFGRHHRHWTSSYFDNRFDCYLYLCPSTQAYYYWCERDVCFYPLSYCPYTTFSFGVDRVCTTCPIVRPTSLPIYTRPYRPTHGGFNNTIHPISGKPAPAPLPQGGAQRK